MNPQYLSKLNAIYLQHLNLPEVNRPKPGNVYKEFERFYTNGQKTLQTFPVKNK